LLDVIFLSTLNFLRADFIAGIASF
jgi:hypothetical protein